MEVENALADALVGVLGRPEKAQSEAEAKESGRNRAVVRTLFAEALAKNGLESKMDTYYEAEKADLPEWTSRAAS